MTAAEHYAARVNAVWRSARGFAGRSRRAISSAISMPTIRFSRPSAPAARRQSHGARRFDRAVDAIVDVGGGAGRMSLPLALRCRSVTNVDPRQASVQLLANAKAARIGNVGLVKGDWLRRTCRKAASRSSITSHISHATSCPSSRSSARRLAPRHPYRRRATPPPGTACSSGSSMARRRRVPGHAELVSVRGRSAGCPIHDVLPPNVR